MHVSSIAAVEEAVLSFSIGNTCRRSRSALAARGLGDFWAHMLVAEGAVDGAVDAIGVREWDLAAVKVIVEEAGGRFSDVAGESRIDSGSAVTRTACCTTSFSRPSRVRPLRSDPGRANARARRGRF